MGVYDDIRQGLEQAIEYEQGKIPARKTTLTILPLSTFTSEEIKAIRHGLDTGIVCKIHGCMRKNRRGMGSGKKSSRWLGKAAPCDYKE